MASAVLAHRLLLWVAMAVAGDSPVPAALLPLPHDGVLQANFRQCRRLHGFKRPIVSTGRLHMVPTRGLVWRMTTPVAGAWVLTPAGLRRHGTLNAEGGSAASPRPATPFMAQLHDTIVALVAGDVAALEQHFKVTDVSHASEGTDMTQPCNAVGQTTTAPRLAAMQGTASPGVWRLHLEPRQAALRRALQSIDVSGQARVEAIAIYEANGDSTAIELSGATVGPLSASVLADFE